MLKKLAAAVIAASTAIIPFSADTVNVLLQTDVYAEDITVKKYDNGTADVVFSLKKNTNSQKSTKITFYDADTGEMIDIPNGSTHLCKYTKQEPYISEAFDITSNPCTVDSSQVYEQLCGYYFTPETRSGWYNDLHSRPHLKILTVSNLPAG